MRVATMRIVTRPGETTSPMIEVRSVSRSFGQTRALEFVDLIVEAREVLALLGPNGAGKTTLVRVLTTLLRPEAGSATVAGFDVVKDAQRVRTVVGLTGQYTTIDPLLTGRENLEMVSELCHLARPIAKERSKQLIEEFELADIADRQARTYSGGMQRRLDLAVSLVARPPLLVLDEPTTGLDPRSRANVWSAVDQLVEGGTTVLLTTQYLEEADRLADRIALMDRGRVVATGTSDELKARLGSDVLDVQIPRGGNFEAAVATLSVIRPLNATDPERRRIALPAPDGIVTLRIALDRLDCAGIQVDDIGIRRPSLDDVFLAMTDAAPVAARSPDASRPSLADVQRAPSTTHEPGAAPEVPRAGRPRTAVRDTWVVTKRNLRRIRRTPRLLIVSSIQPILYVLMFRYVFGGSIRIPRLTYTDYLVPGTLVTAMLVGATTAVAIATDLSAGMVDRFRSLPMARGAVLAGRCVSDLLRCVLVVALVLTVGLCIGFRFHNGPLEAVGGLVLVLAAGFSFIWLYALIGLVVKDPETAQLTGFLMVVPLIFASSAFVRVQNMPGWLQVFARHQPVSVTVNLVRALCEGGPLVAGAWQSALWIVGMIAVCGWLAAHLYQRT